MPDISDLEECRRKIADLEAMVHNCPQCGAFCKQCNCNETLLSDIDDILEDIQECRDAHESAVLAMKARRLLGTIN